jgi:putative aldouronate transport system permease protein
VGLLDTMWSLILPDAIAPFLLIILMTYIRGIPEELEEAAVVEGCSYWRILTRIIIPISKPVLATLTIFYAVGHWNQYFQALIYISDPDKYTLQLRLQIILDLWSSRLQIVQTAQDYGSLVAEGAQAAAIVIATVPIVLIYPFLQRYFIKGVTLGAIKG